MLRVSSSGSGLNVVMEARFVLALDQGTTSSRALVFDRQAAIVGRGQQEFPQIYPEPGLVEHDARAIWSSQRTACEQALAAAGAGPSDIAAVGITNQRETTLVWDRSTGEPIHNAIVWQDRRTAGMCDQLRARGVEAMIAERTGLRLDPYFSATKLRWLLDNVDGAQRAAEAGKLCFGTVDSWLLWQLTGGLLHATDATNASRTLLYDIHRGSWDEELLELFSVPRAMLPEVRDSAGVLGTVAAGLPATGAPIAGVAGDQQAALFGQLCHQPGAAKNTYGTGCFLLRNTGQQAIVSDNQLLTTVAWRLAGVTEYALEGAVFVAGAVVQWLRDELRIVESAAEVDRLAASVPDAGGVYLVPAFTGLGAPHWDPYARGAMFGLTRGTGRAQLCRAALESIALQTADLLDCMHGDADLPLTELKVDGGASNSDVLLQIQADLLGAPVVRPKNVETTVLGAAFLAGLGIGFWRDRAELAATWSEGGRFEPQHRERAGALRAGWARAVERARGWAQS